MSEDQGSRVADTFDHVVSEILAKPYGFLRELDMLSYSDRTTIGVWNKNLPKRVQRCVHDLIYERYLSQPEAPAVSAWGKSQILLAMAPARQEDFFLLNIANCGIRWIFYISRTRFPLIFPSGSSSYARSTK
jgi:hypothetical protein